MIGTQADPMSAFSVTPDLRQTNVGRLLLQSYRQFEYIASNELSSRGYSDLRLPHFQILPHMNVEGARMIDIAQRMNLTRQAISQIADDLEDKGYLLRIPDPEDGRAKRLALTAKGKALLSILPDVVASAERQLGELVGEDLFEALRAGLAKIVERPTDEM